MKKLLCLCLALSASAIFTISAFAEEAKTTYQASFQPQEEEMIGIGYVGGKLTAEQFHDLSKRWMQYSITANYRTCPGNSDGEHHYDSDVQEQFAHSNNGTNGSICYVDIYSAATCADCQYTKLQYKSTVTHTAGENDYNDCLK